MSSRHSHTFAPEKQLNIIDMKYRDEDYHVDDFDSFKGFDDAEEDYLNDEEEYLDEEDFHDEYDDFNDPDFLKELTWEAMTDGQYGDMPEGFDGDYSFMGY